MHAVPQLVPLDHRKASDRDRFLRVAHRLYRDHPHWVAPLDSELHRVLAPANPFFEHAAIQLWVVQQGGRDVGRIAAMEDTTHAAVHGERVAHFGFFEATDDPAVSGALFAAARDWARARNLPRLLGPVNPSINDEAGLLVDGFEAPPVLMMTYAPPYHARLIERAGGRKAKDLVAFHLRLADAPQDRLERLSSVFARRHPELTIRPVTTRSLAADVPKLKRIYNEAWERNWGALPLTDGEIHLLVERLKPLLVDGLVWLAETDDQVAGFLLALPDANEFLRPLRGRLLSPGLFRALPYLVGWKRPDNFRLVALGTRPGFRQRGLEAVLFAETLRAALRLGFVGCEASWVLEDNVRVLRLLETFSARPYKTYRIYELSV